MADAIRCAWRGAQDAGGPLTNGWRMPRRLGWWTRPRVRR